MVVELERHECARNALDLLIIDPSGRGDQRKSSAVNKGEKNTFLLYTKE